MCRQIKLIFFKVKKIIALLVKFSKYVSAYYVVISIQFLILFLKHNCLKLLSPRRFIFKASDPQKKFFDKSTSDTSKVFYLNLNKFFSFKYWLNQKFISSFQIIKKLNKTVFIKINSSVSFLFKKYLAHFNEVVAIIF